MYRCGRKSKICCHSVCSFVFKFIFCKNSIFRDPQAPIKMYEGTQLTSYSSTWWNCCLACVNQDRERNRLKKVMARPHCFGKTGHNAAIRDALLQLGPEIRLHYSLYNREPHKISPKPIWFTEFKVSFYSFC